MNYFDLQGTKIPQIAIGTWSWGGNANGGKMIFGNTLTAAELRPVFEKAVAAGFTLWDTAEVYGLGVSENILGEFMKEHSDIVVSTKFFPKAFQKNESLGKSLAGSNQRLGIECPDIYWIHVPTNVEKWTKELIPLLQSGALKAVGVSNHNLREIKQAQQILNDAGFKLAAVQNHFSLINRCSEKSGILEWCRENHVLFFAYMVLEQGALTGKFDEQHPFKPFTLRGITYSRRVLRKLKPLIDALREIGQQHEASPTEIAIAWALFKQTIPIIGITKEHYVDSLVKASNIVLSTSEVSELESIAVSTDVEIQGSWERHLLKN